MKKKHLLFIAIVFMLVSCNTAPHIQTNEERAEDLISACIKDCLTYPESYETIFTHIDSSFINVSKMGEIIELTEDCNDFYHFLYIDATAINTGGDCFITFGIR